MEIISHLLGREIRVLSIDEVIPMGGVFLPDVIEKISKHYSFQGTPVLNRPPREVFSEGMKFEMGKLALEDRDIPIQQLTFFNDAILVNAFTSADARVILNDVFSWGQSAFGLRPLPEGRQRLYGSQFVAKLHGLGDFVRNHQGILAAIQNQMKRVYDIEDSLYARTLQFDYDRQLLPKVFEPLPAFVIELKANMPYSEDAYFCQMPLPTEQHVELLQLLETMVS
jgi:hypothetical protein